jgi:nucleoid DNA-binding protein
MTMTKNKTVSEIGRRTRLKNRDVQMMVETLIDVWTDELVRGGKVEMEGLFVLEAQTIDRGEHSGILRYGKAPRLIRRVLLRVSKRLKEKLNAKSQS